MNERARFFPSFHLITNMIWLNPNKMYLCHMRSLVPKIRLNSNSRATSTASTNNHHHNFAIRTISIAIGTHTHSLFNTTYSSEFQIKPTNRMEMKLFEANQIFMWLSIFGNYVWRMSDDALLFAFHSGYVSCVQWFCCCCRCHPAQTHINIERALQMLTILTLYDLLF